MYKTVLLAYDGSNEGHIALSEGARLAQICQSSVFLLSVVSPSPGMDVGDAAFTGAIDAQAVGLEAVLAGAVEGLRSMGLRPRSRLTYGDAADQITSVAAEIGADLVVVGHRQRGPLSRWWSGSVGKSLVEKLACSVLIAKHNDHSA